MLILEAIKRADALYPNHFTEDEKLSILYDLSSKIRRELKKEYASIVYGPGESIVLPMGVSFADVKAVISGGRVLRKSEMLNMEKVSHGRTEVIYLTCPAPYRRDFYKCQAAIDGCELYLPETDAFNEGDFLFFTSGKNNGKEARVITSYEDRLYLDTALESQSGEIEFNRFPAYKTECDAPYDEMYVEYLLSRMAFLGQNFDVAKHYTAQANARFTALSCYLKERSAYDAKKIFNLW